MQGDHHQLVRLDHDRVRVHLEWVLLQIYFVVGSEMIQMLDGIPVMGIAGIMALRLSPSATDWVSKDGFWGGIETSAPLGCIPVVGIAGIVALRLSPSKSC